MTIYSKPGKLCNYFHRPWWDEEYGIVYCSMCKRSFYSLDE